MPQVNIFISHSWSYSNHYDKLAEWIFEDPWNVDGAPLNFIDRSVPKDDPIHYAPTDEALRAAIFRRIDLTDVVVIPMGMYANHSKWIQKEIDGARQYAKPILAVNPWGQKRSSSTVRAAAAAEAGWSSESVVKAIWQLAR